MDLSAVSPTRRTRDRHQVEWNIILETYSNFKIFSLYKLRRGEKT